MIGALAVPAASEGRTKNYFFGAEQVQKYESIRKGTFMRRHRTFGFLALAALAATPAAAQTQQWIQQFGTIDTDYGLALTPDGSGGAYFTGRTTGSLFSASFGNFDAWLARYDAGGHVLWSRQFGSLQSDDMYAAASDGVGGVFVGGDTYGNLAGTNIGGTDACLARYDGAGTQQWVRQFGSSNMESVLALASDAAGGVFATGNTEGNLGGVNAGQEDVWLARYDSAGNQLWIQQFGTTFSDDVFAATPDGSGGVILGGATWGDLGGTSAGIPDAWIARYDSSGNRIWLRQFGTSNDDEAHVVTSDGAGGAFIGGWTYGNLGATNAGIADVWLARIGGSRASTVREISSGSRSSGPTTSTV